MRTSLWSRRSAWPLFLEAALILVFVYLLVRLYLLPASDPEGTVQWWAWLAILPPFLLAAALEWRRKKQHVFRAVDLVRPRGD